MSLLDLNMELSTTTNWTKITTNSIISKDTNSPHSGTYCLKLLHNGELASCYNNSANLQDSKIYTIDGYCCSDGNSIPVVGIGGTSASYLIFTGTNSMSWQHFNVNIFTSGVYVSLFLAQSTGTNNTYVKFDDITITAQNGLSIGTAPTITANSVAKTPYTIL